MLCFPSLFACMSLKPYCALCLARHAIPESVPNSSKPGGMVYSGIQLAAEFWPLTLNFGMYRISTSRPCPTMPPNSTISIQIVGHRIEINEFAHLTTTNATRAQASIHNKSHMQTVNFWLSCPEIYSDTKFVQSHTVSLTQSF